MILAVNRMAVTTVDELSLALGTVRGTFAVQLVRDGAQLLLVVPMTGG